MQDPAQALALLPLNDTGRTERQWLQDAISWLRTWPVDERTLRLRQMADAIQADPALKARFRAIWTRAYAPRLFSEAGVPEATSLGRELVARLKRRILPQVEDDLDLYATLQSADLDRADADWVAALSPKDAEPWRDLIGGSRSDSSEAIRLLALRAAAIGLSRGVMCVMPHRYETESPFFDLVDAASALARNPEAPDARQRLHDLLRPCRISAGMAHVAMEEHGVSADLVFRLDLVFAQLERIDVLLQVMNGREDGCIVASMLVRAVAGERGAHSLIRNSVNRVARHVVAHTGKSGEHYIAGSRSEWARMGYGAVGAGVITAFTALFKYSLAATAMAPLWIGVAHSLNYTFSFVLMQFLGWRLASKMPAMTAAALSDALLNEDGMQSEVKLVATIARTQTIVTAGNLLGAIPAAMLIDLVLQLFNGKPFLSQAAAAHGVESMHPLRSFTIPFAALTGCFLWLSSLFAGWTANWMVLNRLPAAIAQNRRLRSTFGDGNAARFAGLVKHHLSGVAGYVCLGLLLGLVPFVSVFAGIPLEVRHITLASASLAYDFRALIHFRVVPWEDLGWAMIGLFVTGLLNFSVSFALGLWLALRARNLDTKGRKELVVALWNEFRHQPARFLWRHEADDPVPPADVVRDQ